MNRATSLAILISLAGAWELHAQNTEVPVVDSANLPTLNSLSSAPASSGTVSPLMDGWTPAVSITPSSPAVALTAPITRSTARPRHSIRPTS